MGWTSPKTWTAAVLLVADMNTYNRDNLAYLKANIALDAPTELTIAAGVITKTKSYHTIDTAGDAATDDLDTINGGADGEVIYLQAAHTDRTVIVKNGMGNINSGHDIELDNTEEVIALIYNATNSEWHPVGHATETVEILINSFSFPAGGTDWTEAVTGATLAQNKAAKIVLMPIDGLTIGDSIVSYKLVGDVVEAAAATVDCKLVRVNKADPITTSDIAGGAITQVTADGNFDSTATLTAPEVAATDKQYILQITGTTGAGDSIIVMGAEVILFKV